MSIGSRGAGPPSYRHHSRRAFLTRLLSWSASGTWFLAHSSLSRGSFLRSLWQQSDPAAFFSVSKVFNFARLKDQAGWGRRWYLLHYGRVFRVRNGQGELKIPRGLATTAPDQPMPVFLLDHESRHCDQTLTFSVTNRTMRPGVLFGGRGTFSYLAVTFEGRRLVLANYTRTTRTVIERRHVGRLRRRVRYHLQVRVVGRKVQARVWRQRSRIPEWQLRATLPFASRRGKPGILLVHQKDLGAGTLYVKKYRIDGRRRFGPTRPHIAFALAGIPAERGGTKEVKLRMASAFPAAVTFEWTNDPTWQTLAGKTKPLVVRDPPHTATHTVSVDAGQDLYWRAHAASLSSPLEVATPTHSILAFDPSQKVALTAASCAQLWGKPAYQGFQRVLEAAPSTPRALVFQGDMGYANNIYRSCYFSAEDFFYDRFVRFLADPHFRHLREQLPVGFTQDDHDYGPQNNASGSEIPSWAIDLWDQIHANPSRSGYFDFRLGDIHCLTLDVRRYADSPDTPDSGTKTRLGAKQAAWLGDTLQSSDAGLFVIFSGGIFASRARTKDCWLFGWPDEYKRVMALFTDLQLGGKRIIVISGDAHGFRVHYHPDPEGRPQATGLSVVEFICSGLEARTWSGAVEGDASLDPIRNVMRRSGLGLIEIDPPSTVDRSITLRAIASHEPEPVDLFPQLRLSFLPQSDGVVEVESMPEAPPGTATVQLE